MKNLNVIIKDSLNQTATLIDEKNSIVLVSFEKGEFLEYATFKYNDNGLYSGHYFTTRFSSNKKAKKDALHDFDIRVNF
ncbi:hypothetical protein [Staphylococcus gallinarum]|uniref:hypothetical protein n=1 Tax=Staphylococcus gallinarum TaxID=1293 RepID=UPI001E42066B|nr:hypothetical protein [Staphylococcus gallinarum]MCD8845223.1 hypothetical protein [Staphylococcus gallinarum]